jgi:uncharacterized protein (UPF0332 family)
LLTAKRLIRVATGHSKDQQLWSEGVSLERDAGAPLAQVQIRVSAARFELAKSMHADARRALLLAKPAYRTVISRAYYSMYHSFRAAAFLFYGGDDYEQHTKLSLHLPADFPNFAVWANQLKSAREYRNQADYEAYPKTGAYWKSISTLVLNDSKSLLPVAAAYLNGKGCNL